MSLRGERSGFPCRTPSNRVRVPRMGNRSNAVQQTVGTTDERLPHESEMTDQIQGSNQLIGNEQIRAREERRGILAKRRKRKACWNPLNSSMPRHELDT